MRIYMYEALPNFGDVLNKHIWPRYFGRWLERSDDILMFGIGTLLGDEVKHHGRVLVCGSGCGYQPDISRARAGHFKYFFVRGPNTASVLELPDETAITDPAILVTEAFEKAPASGRAVFVPHWETSANPLWKRACALADIDYVDPLSDVRSVIAQLSGARLVIAEAMHGAIVADAYRVPWVPVSTSARVNSFKWHDWALSVDVKLSFQALPPLGISDGFRSMTVTSSVRQSALRGSGEYAAVPEKTAFAAGALAASKLLDSKLLSEPMRRRIEHTLLWRIGPRLDRVVDLAVGAGIPVRRMDEIAKQLADAARGDGTLSLDSTHERLSARVHDKLGEVERYLETTD